MYRMCGVQEELFLLCSLYNLVRLSPQKKYHFYLTTTYKQNQYGAPLVSVGLRQACNSCVAVTAQSICLIEAAIIIGDSFQVVIIARRRVELH